MVSATTCDDSDDEILLERRGDDAATFVDWLLEGTLTGRYSTCNPIIDEMMAQLFVESSINGRNGELIAGSYLAAGTQIDEEQSMCSYDTSEWHLTVNLEPVVIDAVLDVLARRSPQFSDVVTATRDPKSRAGRARRRALKKLVLQP